MRTTKAVLAISLFLLLLTATTLVARQDKSVQRGARNSDAYLKREVGHELNQVPWYTVFDMLQYSVQNDVVTLTGQVTQPSVKSDAENAVKHIEGVDRVNDQIEVLPPSPMDEQLRLAEYRSIYSQPTLQKYGVGNLQSIHIIVKGGHVTLEGIVNSEQDKNVASIAAKTVPNVFSVDNHLNVSSASSAQSK